MAAKRSAKSHKVKPKKKIRKSAPARRGASKRKAKPKVRVKPRRSTRPKAKARAKARRPAKPKAKARAGAKVRVKAKAVPRAKLKARAQSSFEHAEPQGMLELDEGPPITELTQDPDLVMPPLPRKRRSKGQQLSMLDYPGESLTVGMPAPDFSLPSTLGRRVSLSEFRGKRVALYFYPKDDTPGCTMEACAFRDHMPRIEAKNAVVLGVSLDDELSHERFAQKYNLPFPLLSDKDAAVSRQYGTYKEKSLYGRSFWGIERTTFVIDRDGKVEHVFRRVKVEGHAEEVMATLAL